MHVVYVCEDQSVHVPVWWVHMHTCKRVCGGQRLVYGVVLDTSSPCIMRQGLLYPELADVQLSLDSQPASETVCFCLHRLYHRQATESAQFLGELLGSKCQFSHLSDKCFNCPAISPGHLPPPPGFTLKPRVVLIAILLAQPPECQDHG